MKKDCPDAQALSLRLRDAITNSKAKKYHGSSEHMNELPPMDQQAKALILNEPSPFVFYEEEKKEFLDEQDPFWEKSVL